MPKTSNLIGRRFGRLTVLAQAEGSEDHYRLWRCRCDCGNEILVNTKRLTQGIVTHCGCAEELTLRRGRHAEDLTGRRFGMLTVLHRTENRHGRTCWLCRCDCGNTHAATARDLKAGKVTSCGCRKQQPHVITNLQERRFGRLTVLYPTDKRDKNGCVYWHCRCDCGDEVDISEDCLVQGNNRSCGCLKREAQQAIPTRLHRVDGTCVEWLEKRKHRCDNTSGFRGVYPMKSGRYRATIGFKGRRYTIGSYDNFEAAVAARLEAEELIHGGFVKAYARWRAQADALPDQEKSPFYFEVEKVHGEFRVITSDDL